MKTIKDARIWSVFVAAIALRVLPERVKGQHRAADLAMWISAFPRSKS